MTVQSTHTHIHTSPSVGIYYNLKHAQRAVNKQPLLLIGLLYCNKSFDDWRLRFQRHKKNADSLKQRTTKWKENIKLISFLLERKYCFFFGLKIAEFRLCLLIGIQSESVQFTNKYCFKIYCLVQTERKWYFEHTLKHIIQKKSPNWKSWFHLFQISNKICLSLSASPENCFIDSHCNSYEIGKVKYM